MDQQIERAHHRLIDTLCASGAVSTDWEPTFRAVPRHLFIPDAIWTGERPPLRPVLRQQEPHEWLELVHSDVALITQLDDGATAPGQPGHYPTSSISQPSLVAMMLARTELTQGHRVLEIGTGTGYNAALLAHHLGSATVTTIEIDPSIADSARSALEQAGLGEVTVITGDGALGHPPHAPYDRVLATATCHAVPLAWIEQTRPDGRIVTPWASSYHNGVLLHLDVTDKSTAVGRFAGNISFMWLREQRIPFGWLSAQPEAEATYRHTSTTAHPYRLNDVSASFVVGVLTPGCHYQLITRNGDPYDAVMWLFDPASGSRAAVTITPGATEFPIRQYGPRSLWDEASAAYDWWGSAGRPRYDRFGLTVTAAGQQIWLDSPQHPIPRNQTPLGTKQ
jgi:protein-L-isoaspartate(D-aspartate) O-methyltransferase